MKRRSFFNTLLAMASAFPFILFARKIEGFEFTPSDKRKRVDRNWMHMNKSFDYYDYDFIDDMGFGHLRVIDDFEISKLAGTPVHPHKDMEILTIILEGQIFHQDSIGNSGLLKSGAYQIMSAGTGIRHAETNPSQFETLKGLQIWISSTNSTGKPNYQQREAHEIDLQNKLTLIAGSRDKKAMHIENDVQIYRGAFTHDKKISYTLNTKSNGVYIYMIKGQLELFDRTLKEGDGLGVAYKEQLDLTITKNSDFLLLEVPLQGEF